MSDEFIGKLEGKRSTDAVVSVTADADNSKIVIGENSERMIALDANVFGINGTTSKIQISNKPGFPGITIHGDGFISVEGFKASGNSIDILGSRGAIEIRGPHQEPLLTVNGDSKNIAIFHSTEIKALEFNAKIPEMHIRNPDGKAAFAVDGRENMLNIFNPNGNKAVGLNGQANAMAVFDQNGRTAINLNGGANAMAVFNQNGNRAFEVEGRENMLNIFNPNGNKAIGLNGGANAMAVFNQNGNITLHFDGNSGDIQLLNADCAEEFDILPQEIVEPGTVMVINNNGVLEPNREAYDKRVAGIISGAGDKRPGIVLDKQQQSHKNEKRLPIALMGKVYCKVDATIADIEVGDLLTTSPTQGHAMKVTDHVKALGAIIGKALKPLREDRGMIPVLVALQ